MDEHVHLERQRDRPVARADAPARGEPAAFAPLGGFKDNAARHARHQAAPHRPRQSRGGKVVFVRFPMAGELKKLEDAATPRAGPWTRILKESGAAGIYFEDYPELAGFDCPEWSHLSGPDSVEFTKRLVPHLQAALAR